MSCLSLIPRCPRGIRRALSSSDELTGFPQLVTESLTLDGDASLVTGEHEWVNTALARLTTRHRELYERHQLDAVMMPVIPTLPPLMSEVLEERDDLGKRGYEAEDRLHVLPLERLWV